MQLPYDTHADEPSRVARPVTIGGTADGTGAVTLTSDPVPFGDRWLINYLTFNSVGANDKVSVYVDEVSQSTFIDGIEPAVANVIAYTSPRVLDQGQLLLAVFAGAQPGTRCTMRIEYDIERVS